MFVVVMFVIFVAVLAPMKVTLMLLVLLGGVPIIVRILAKAIGKVEVSFGDAAKAVAYGLGTVLLILAALGTIGKGTAHVGTPMALVLFAAYTLAYKFALGTSTRASAAIAIASTAASAPLGWLILYAI
jgi:hypothetical protein